MKERTEKALGHAFELLKILPETERIIDLKKELTENAERVSALEENWDTDGAHQPTTDILEEGFLLIARIALAVFEKYAVVIPPPYACAARDGSIGFEWRIDPLDMLLILELDTESGKKWRIDAAGDRRQWGKMIGKTDFIERYDNVPNLPEKFLAFFAEMVRHEPYFHKIWAMLKKINHIPYWDDGHVAFRANMFENAWTLYGLKADWDEEDALPPSHEVIEKAFLYVINLAGLLFTNEKLILPPLSINPLPSGPDGLDLEWRVKNFSLLVNLKKDGTTGRYMLDVYGDDARTERGEPERTPTRKLKHKGILGFPDELMDFVAEMTRNKNKRKE